MAATVPHQFRTVDPRGPEAIEVLRSYLTEVSSRIPAAVVSEDEVDDVDDFMAPNGLFTVITSDERVLGGGAVRLLDKQTAELKRMWIEPDARGSGLGTALLAELERQAGQLGCRRARLDTNHVLTEAVELYRRCGYLEIQRYNDNPDADLYFEKPLDA
jgi:GNAT superfamily N-acetyltransferase